MALSGKITTISCQVDLSATKSVSNSNFGHYKKWVIDVDKMLMYPLQLILCMLLPKKKKASQSLNSV